MQIKEIKAKSILVPSKIPSIDYAINPYTGCSFGCIYCYASFMGRYVDKEISDWGDYVFVKSNAPDLLQKDLRRLKNSGKGKVILLSSVTDPYQGLEVKYKLTRQCLQILLDYGFEVEVSILTKSPLVLRDMDLLSQLKNVEVGLTITSTDSKISKYFEQHAPDVTKRLEALRKLNDAGLNTHVFVGPLLPHFVANEQSLDKLFKAIKNAGTTELFVEHINMKRYIVNRMKGEMKDLDKGILDKFYESRNKKYRERLNRIVLDLVKKHGLKLRLGSAIYHQEMVSKKTDLTG